MARHTAKSHKIRKVEILVIQIIIFTNQFPVSYKKAQRHGVLNLCGVVLLSIGHFLKVSLCEPAFMRASGICFIKWL